MLEIRSPKYFPRYWPLERLLSCFRIACKWFAPETSDVWMCGCVDVYVCVRMCACVSMRMPGERSGAPGAGRPRRPRRPHPRRPGRASRRLQVVVGGPPGRRTARRRGRRRSAAARRHRCLRLDAAHSGGRRGAHGGPRLGSMGLAELLDTRLTPDWPHSDPASTHRRQIGPRLATDRPQIDPRSAPARPQSDTRSASD